MMIEAIMASFGIAGLFNFFYLFLQTKRERKRITVKQVIIRIIGCGITVAIGYMLRQFSDSLQLAGHFSGGFILSVVIPGFIFLWYKINPDFFHKQQNYAMMLLCQLAILILITHVLGA